MASRLWIAALGIIAAASPVSANRPDLARPTAAPPGGPATRYCLRIESTDTRIEIVKCWTREEWAEQGVDVDADWPKEGVSVIG